ncbi:rfaE bifunctional protein, domain I [Catalinimonas alkaloidigena]|uniref:RfaE bifunctional protein, domain I n=1 Tax=Catalinimonas alkaloidigena TaxID=1075417 RepID=A0A1G9HT79_9BACT|nr:bifunctional ADP-heptose synthase [Catalinimonas alkaloidigena]SDL15934.1 rfaE bifunctional protein, domain I [Catalinimonas alkaloidigena]
MPYTSLRDVFDAFRNLKVLIIGDVMVDSYLWGKVDRISPEAPVPIISVKQREKRLGGAGNVALNVQALGATPMLASVIGEDADGDELVQLLSQQQLTTEAIARSASRITTIKHRIISGSHHMLRIDSEDDSPLPPEDRQRLLDIILAQLPHCHVVIFEDYDKGVLGEELIQEVIAAARRLAIPTVVDPKKRNFRAYRQATLFKPNLKELREGMHLDLHPQRPESLAAAVAQLQEQMDLEGVLLTLSEHGMYLQTHQEHHRVPAHLRTIADVSGAGDTVVSVAAVCLALALPGRLLLELANLAGGLVCEAVGVVPIAQQQFLAEAERNQLFRHYSSSQHSTATHGH